jgi:glycosyltransferase involved in cell wall biosynthesis
MSQPKASRTAAALSARAASGFPSLDGKVALLVPAYRSETTVRATLQSVLAQGNALGVLKCVILSDDAGGDKTNQVAQETWQHDVPLVVRRCTRNLGEYRNCNEVIGELPPEVEWVLILHADDLVKAGWLEKMLRQLEHAHPDLASVSSSWDDLQEDDSIVEGENDATKDYLEFPGTRDTVRDTLFLGCWWHISSCAIRVSAFKKVGGLPANGMRHKGDWYLLTKFFNAGFRVGYIPKALMLYRRNPVSSSAQSYRATGDITEALWVIRQFAPRLKIREILHLHRVLLQNVLVRGAKSLLLLRLPHFFSLTLRAKDILLGGVASLVRSRKSGEGPLP